ncbi:hypothetical protein VMT65_06220 [Nocardia sp. CDC153]|nr:hypothetical protein [Nocardia sp. CDC153]MEC3952620.1 hypothetical protein [Nocardia sp. CDC153]
MKHQRAGLAWQQYVYAGSRAWHWLRVASGVGAGTFLVTLLWLTYTVLR